MLLLSGLNAVSSVLIILIHLIYHSLTYYAIICYINVTEKELCLISKQSSISFTDLPAGNYGFPASYLINFIKFLLPLVLIS
ncbi:hypothetical protein HMPREF1548_03695 [Clostridium sp. KLE 1755]|nr:hypothetical protein HMPREF1548_03695 [Clostridium sp. KLE 1755]